MRKFMTAERGARAALRRVAVAALLGAAATASAQKAFFEDFETLPLGPNREEALAGAKVWTHTPPPGWTQDDSQMPGLGNPAQDGITEWVGWSFANRNWWVQTAGDQRRSDFTFGQGTVLIADNDEWDDATHAKGFWTGFISTPAINITGYAANSLVLAFDSSWRPEARDDAGATFPTGPNGEAINNQTGLVFTTFDAGSTNEIIRYESTRTLEDGSDNPFFKEDRLKSDATNPDEVSNSNEPVIVPLNNPGGATTLKVTFGSILAANDWWWAVDNIAVGVPPLVTGVSGTGVGVRVRISEALNKNVDDTKPITLTVDGVAKAPVTVNRDGSLVFVAFSQSPAVYQPGSKHDVLVNFSTSDNRQVSDGGSFIAPGYTTVATTPAVITATVTSPSFFAVDTAKGATLTLDGVAVTPTSVTPFTDPVAGLTIRYALPTALAPNSSHVLAVTFTTDGNVQVTDPVTFTASNFKTLFSDLGTALGTGAQPGMRWRTHQLAAGRDNSIAAVEQQLAGQSGPSVHDDSLQVAAGYFEVPFVNFEQAGGGAGIFRADGEGDLSVPEEFIPGIPGTTGSTDNIATEALTFVEIPTAGIYTMVVRSDDGFQVSVGNLSNPLFQVLGSFDGGRGDAPTEFYFQATKAGVYLFRLIWFEGGGGASVEWYTVNANGSAALVGGSQPGALKAFRVRTVAEPVLTTVPATITAQPVSVEVQEGNSAALSVTAIGDAPLSYQWFRGLGAGATAIPGATTSKLILSKAKVSDSGLYSVVVKNNVGTNTSTGAQVTVLLRARSKVLLKEDFEGLALGPNVEEGIATGSGGALPNVWTKTAPAGWAIDDSGVPGAGTANDGVTEWAGWSFAKREWWASTAGDQTRTRFVKGVGAIAVVDGDEWDDLPRTAGSMTSLLTTKPINVAGVAANSVVLKFDSSWRPEAPQKAAITVKYDGGAPVEVLRWTADAGPTFHADNQNETVTLALNNPGNANTMTITFAYLDAGNNWWWAFDNLEVTGDPIGFDSLQDSLAVYLPFNGNYNDASGNGVNGAARGTPTFVNGKVGQGVNVSTIKGPPDVFNYVTLGRQLLFGTSKSFTAAFWARVNTHTGDPSFLSNKDWGGGGNVGFVIATDSDNRIQWNLNTVGGARKDFDSAGGVFADSAWKHIAISFDRGGNAETWVDGVKIDARDISANNGQELDTPNLALNIGQDGVGTYTDGGGVYHNSDIDEVAIWNRILGDAEIVSVYTRGTTGTPLIATTVAQVVVAATRTGDDLTVTWTGGTGPFLIQTAAALGAGWLDTLTTPNRTVTIPLVGGAGFVRIIDGTAKNVQLFKAHLDSQQEPNKPVSNGKGAGIAVLDGLNLTYYVSYEGLGSGVTGAHIHNAAVGVNGPVFVPFSPVVGSTSGIITGTATLTAAQKVFIETGVSYFNIHTSVNGGGEIRGQILP